MSRKKFSSRERRGIIALFAILSVATGMLLLTRRHQPEGDMRPYRAIPSHLCNPSDSSAVEVDSSGAWSAETAHAKKGKRRKNGKKKKKQKKQHGGTGSNKPVNSRNPRMEEIPTD